jgi:putative Holliday junction resolvase
MRILGVDYGSKRIGLSMSDPSARIASPLGIRHRVSASQDGEFFRELVRSHQLARVVVGLPKLTDGTEGEKAQEARKYGAWLAAELGLPVDFYDERYTSAEAESRLKKTGMKARGRKKRRDMLAAQIMLQAYLDSEGIEDPGALEDAEANYSN